jgi:hypothetical protein
VTRAAFGAIVVAGSTPNILPFVAASGAPVEVRQTLKMSSRLSLSKTQSDYRERAGCAIATELATRASNAIVVINFRMMGLPVWGPLSRLW